MIHQCGRKFSNRLPFQFAVSTRAKKVHWIIIHLSILILLRCKSVNSQEKTASLHNIESLWFHLCWGNFGWPSTHIIMNIVHDQFNTPKVSYITSNHGNMLENFRQINMLACFGFGLSIRSGASGLVW